MSHLRLIHDNRLVIKDHLRGQEPALIWPRAKKQAKEKVAKWRFKQRVRRFLRPVAVFLKPLTEWAYESREALALMAVAALGALLLVVAGE